LSGLGQTTSLKEPNPVSKFIEREDSMKERALCVACLMSCLALLMSGSATAQTKISGTLKCEKPDPVYSIDVGDRPGHVMMLQKQTCSYTQPAAINTVKEKDASGVVSAELNSSRVTYTGSYVNNMENGDKFFTTIKGTATMKNGKSEGDHGTWTYTEGTGKLKGIKGKGTYKSTMNEDGSINVEFEGDYEFPLADRY
jgi:hypothetical protein